MKKSAFSLIELSIVIIIIAIAIASTVGASRAILNSKLRTAQSQIGASSIASIPGLKVWLEPVMDGSFTNASNSTYVQNGDKIKSWNDYNPESVFKVNPSQSTSTYQPTYVSNGINNLPSLQFNNSEFLSSLPASGGVVPLSFGNDSLTFVAVFKRTALADQVIFEQNATSVAAGQRASMFLSGTSPYNIGFVGESNDFMATSSLSYASQGSAYIAVITVNNSGAVATYLNTTTSPSGSTGTISSATENVAEGGFYVAVKGSNSLQKFSGLISEIMVFDRAVSSSELSEIMTYLSKKYNIVLV